MFSFFVTPTKLLISTFRKASINFVYGFCLDFPVNIVIGCGLKFDHD